MKITDMNYGLNEIVLAAIKAEEKNSKASKYTVLTCADGEQQIEVKLWKTKDELERELGIKVPTVLELMIEKQMYNGTTSYVMNRINKKLEEEPKNYMPHAPIDAGLVFDYICSSVSACKDQDLRKITSYLLTKHKEDITYSPAAMRIHHNYLSGLLYHTYRMLKLAESMGNMFPDVNEDLLFCGVILHDIGKIKELQMDEVGAIGYTVEGNLLGHCVIGIQMIERAAFALDLDPDTESIKLLEHLIASHHGELEFGAIVKPGITEAMLLHEIDMIESRKWQYEKAEAETEPGTMSDKVFGLGNVMIYKKINKGE